MTGASATSASAGRSADIPFLNNKTQDRRGNVPSVFLFRLPEKNLSFGCICGKIEKKAVKKMEERFYQIGGMCVRMSGCLYRESAPLSPFRTNTPGEVTENYIVEAVPQLTLPQGATVEAGRHELTVSENGQAVRYLLRDGTNAPLLSETVCGKDHTVRLAEATLPLWDSNLVMKLWQLPQRLFAMGEIFLHASMVEYRGEAILFTGQKQIGKSTQAALWEQYQKAEVINGDRALLRKDGGQWYACGSPYCGTSKICKNGCFPLRAVVLLSQAKENTVRRATAHEAIAAFLDGCTFDAGSRTQAGYVMDCALDLYAKTAVLKLACLPEVSAVECLLQAL